MFRKFAADFSEKHRVKPIQLDEEARSLILKYRFPGNIRQLKNLVDQMSVLEMDRTITAPTLRKYLPDNHRHMPVLLGSGITKESDISERDILYKVLFDMKKDVTELKKLVFELLRGDQGEQLLKQHQGLFQNIEEEPAEELSPYMLPERETSDSTIEIKEVSPDIHDVQDITHETEDDDSLSIEKKERELIIKALHKNNNKRKYAAQDLGISERTLYRKIKQYQIED